MSRDERVSVALPIDRPPLKTNKSGIFNSLMLYARDGVGIIGVSARVIYGKDAWLEI